MYGNLLHYKPYRNNYYTHYLVKPLKILYTESGFDRVSASVNIGNSFSWSERAGLSPKTGDIIEWTLGNQSGDGPITTGLEGVEVIKP